MTAWPRQNPTELNAFYGNPDTDGNGIPDRAWEDRNLTVVVPPWQMVLAWDTSVKLRTIRVNRKCADSLLAVLQEIWEAYGRDQRAIEAARLHLYGGCYNFRLMRGGSKLSMHSWGCAIDLDPEKNGLGVPYNEAAGMMPMKVVKIFEKHGWGWGGRWRRADSMHMEAVSQS